MAAVPTVRCDKDGCTVTQQLPVALQWIDDHREAHIKHESDDKDRFTTIFEELSRIRWWIIGTLVTTVLAAGGIIVTLLHAATQAAEKGAP